MNKLLPPPQKNSVNSGRPSIKVRRSDRNRKCGDIIENRHVSYVNLNDKVRKKIGKNRKN
jgi:hypothetical protein